MCHGDFCEATVRMGVAVALDDVRVGRSVKGAEVAEVLAPFLGHVASPCHVVVLERDV